MNKEFLKSFFFNDVTQKHIIFNRRIWIENFSSFILPIYHIQIKDILLKGFELEFGRIYFKKDKEKLN